MYRDYEETMCIPKHPVFNLYVTFSWDTAQEERKMNHNPIPYRELTKALDVLLKSGSIEGCKGIRIEEVEW